MKTHTVVVLVLGALFTLSCGTSSKPETDLDARSGNSGGAVNGGALATGGAGSGAAVATGGAGGGGAVATGGVGSGGRTTVTGGVTGGVGGSVTGGTTAQGGSPDSGVPNNGTKTDGGTNSGTTGKRKPRVVVMTDGEIDDHSSMIRFLLYTCDVEVLAIIETNSIFQSNGHSKEEWYEKQLEAYGKIHPNLIKHNPDYPTVEKLRSISFVGDEDFEHLKGLRALRWDLVPGYKITFSPENWPDTPGSNRIVEVLLENNPDPVHIQAWGGGNTAARAFHKLKTEHPADYERAISKVVMYNIWYQDGAGNYIEKTHPKATLIYCGSFAGTWNYNSQKGTGPFITNNVKTGHGPLGALYPQTYISEGDSPAFFYTVVSGLRNHEHPTYGGWGGRFEKTKSFENVYADASDDGDKKVSLRRWIAEVNRNYEARMDWCVAEYAKANHEPVVKVEGAVDRVVKSGETVTLSGKGTTDPDGNTITFKWWQYVNPGTHKGTVALQGATTPDVTFTAPKVTQPETIHLILQATDNGSPVLDGYQRVIITVQP